MKEPSEKTPVFDYIEAVLISGTVTIFIVSRILKESAKHSIKNLISKTRRSCKKKHTLV